MELELHSWKSSNVGAGNSMVLWKSSKCFYQELPLQLPDQSNDYTCIFTYMLLIISVFLVLLCSTPCPWTYYVAQASVKFTAILPPPSILGARIMGMYHYTLPNAPSFQAVVLRLHLPCIISPMGLKRSCSHDTEHFLESKRKANQATSPHPWGDEGRQDKGSQSLFQDSGWLWPA